MKIYLALIFLTIFLCFPVHSKTQDHWPEMSIYHLTGIWKNQAGESVQLSSFSKKPVIAAMVYTSCEHTCPMITSEMLQIRKKLPKGLQKKVTYALISFDSKGDTSKVLRAYKKKRKLDDHWILLTADEKTVRQLAAVLGVNYKKTQDGGFSHSNIISLIDQKGVVVTKIDGLNQPNNELIQKTQQILKNVEL